MSEQIEPNTPRVSIGTEEYPIRMSSLTTLMKCPGSYVLEIGVHSEGSWHSDTGNAVGRAIELYHRQVETSEIMPMVESEAQTGVTRPGNPRKSHGFPKADLDTVRKILGHYADDPRNPRSIVLEDSLEEEVNLRIDPDPSDPTQTPIFLRGHIDQVRRGVSGGYEVWDAKNVKEEDGFLVVAKYLFQQAAYTLAYAQKYPDRRVTWGGLIRVKAYLSGKRENGRSGKIIQCNPGEHRVFIRGGMRNSDLERAMRQVAKVVADCRRGRVILYPGDACRFCAGQDFNLCYDKLEERGFIV